MKPISILLSLILSTACQTFAGDYMAAECPVVGNSKSSIFHVKGCPNYTQMLEQNKGHDNRKCFSSRSEAENSGYRISKNCRKEVYEVADH